MARVVDAWGRLRASGRRQHSVLGVTLVVPERLGRVVSCPVAFNVPLARLSTYRIGGPASAVVSPERAEDVAVCVDFAAGVGLPWIAVGLGSNVLFADDGFAGIVIKIGRGLHHVEVLNELRWRIGAGLPTPILAKRTATAGLTGLNRLIGVPGAVGGGVFMNAGAHGQEFKDVVRSVVLVRPDGSIAEVPAGAIPWEYRSSGLDGAVIEVVAEFAPADPDVLNEEIRRYLSHRRSGTPFDQPCCGSVFRNPTVVDQVDGIDGTPTAGRLIEAAGMKNFRVGGAVVSPVHANYIVNTGGAKAADVLAVIDAVSQAVLSRFGIAMATEVRTVGKGARA